MSRSGGPHVPQLASHREHPWMEPVQRVILRHGDSGGCAPVSLHLHCHLLQHEDNGMMGQFVVVQPGQPPASLPSHQHRG